MFDLNEAANWAASSAIGGTLDAGAEIELGISLLDDGRVSIAWEGEGVLKSSATVDGQFTEINDASSPYVVQPEGPTFFLVETP